MADWSGVQQGLVSGFQIGQKTGGRFSGLGTAISQVAEALKTQQAQQQEMAQKQNLLGYEGLMKGTVAPAQAGDTGAVNVPGIGNVVPKNDLPVYKTAADGSIVQVGTMKKGGKLEGQGYGSAGINFAEKNAPAILDAIKNNDFSGYLQSNANTRTAVAALASREGISLNKGVLGYKAQQQYTNPNTKVGQNVTSLNTVVGHLGQLNDSIDSLRASGQPLENAVVLTARNLTGDPTITDYNTASEVVNNEIQRALSGVGVTQEGMQRQGAILPKAGFGDKQAKQYVNSLAHLVKTRLDTVESGYKQQVGSEPGDLVTYPESKQILNNIIGNDTNSGYKPIRAVQPPDNSAVMSTETSGKKDYSSLWQ